nr:L,D-transpeptidase family protein [Limoniibacter endophyticus]
MRLSRKKYNRQLCQTFGRGKLHIIVRQKPGNRSRGILAIGGQCFPCSLGRGGVVSRKREGDGGTPLARMRVLYGFFREGRGGLAPSLISVSRVSPAEGWCDAPTDRNYNRKVRLPYRASHEMMQRSDHLYDIGLVLDWNISMRKRNTGSAIFLHLAQQDFKPTEGCIAVTRPVMNRLLRLISRESYIEVRH